MDDQTQPNLPSALALAARGWPVIPLHHLVDGACSCPRPNCKSPGKHPRTKNGVKNATKDLDQVKSWWRQWPSANVGIGTGTGAGIVAIDIDPRNGGAESLATLEAEHDPLPATVESLTGGGGRHLIFTYPSCGVGNRSNVRPGIDVRGDGGYIVAPPSTHVSGELYRWRDGHSPEEIDVAAIPDWLLELIQQPAALGAKDRESEGVPDASDDRYALCLQSLLKLRTSDHGDGSKRLFTAACRCVEFDLTDEQAESCIRAYATARPFPTTWSRDDILARLKDAKDKAERGARLPDSAALRRPEEAFCHPYLVTEHGTIWMKDTKEGAVPTPLMNFSAKIVEEVVHDDGAEQQRIFEIEAVRNGRSHIFSVPASRFAAMNWPTEELGAGAILYPGFGTRDHARCAIQMLSGTIPRQVVYRHLGWRKVDGQRVYLHAGGAIGASDQVHAQVEPPEALLGYRFPDPPCPADLRDAVRVSLDILDLAPDVVSVPVWLAIWRSVLGPADFSIFLCGHTGAGKTELSALAQQHFGAGLDARHLPASWSSTANALEVLAFSAKDALLVIDDFAPNGTSADVARFHKEADRILRAQGNRAGRARLTSDAQLRADRPPRGLILSTAEDIPRGHSVRARALVLEMPPNGMDWQALTNCQQLAAQGVFSQALAGFIRWVAINHKRIYEERSGRTAELRSQVQAAHKRTPGIVAELAWAAELFAQFTEDVGALLKNKDSARDFAGRCWTALVAAADAQAEHHAAADPVRRFQELLASAVASGRAHLAGADGGVPPNPGAWGWRGRTASSKPDGQAEWQQHGDRIGWVENHEILLDPDAAYRAAGQMSAGDGLTMQPRTLWKRMSERGLLRHREGPHLTVKRSLDCARRRVLCLPATYLTEVGQLGHGGPRMRKNGHRRPTSPPHFSEHPEVSGAENWGDAPQNVGSNGVVSH